MNYNKNENDVMILEAMIHEQNAHGAVLPADPEHRFYHWDKNGRLTELYLEECSLSGTLDFSGLDALKRLYCYDNALTGLDVSGCPALEHLHCSGNALASLDTGACPQLVELYCSNNRLKSLDVSRNPALNSLFCHHNALEDLDISGNPALKYLYCDDNVRVQKAEPSMDNCIKAFSVSLDGQEYGRITEKEEDYERE